MKEVLLIIRRIIRIIRTAGILLLAVTYLLLLSTPHMEKQHAMKTKTPAYVWPDGHTN